ncbi:hypothetical protein DFH08DRAFT_978630 [Mycena albidolilacea]|uniref:Uncharacterized protein n=1 Tax=Mycena albidolilacea TaxID=1033008 RepID=A0AAD7E7W2_9AGAR|nr:hypothetical protein DFH08DRAFT_978630 [Mycena albidolilacea]
MGAANSKAYGLLYLVLDQDVKTKIDNANVQRSSCLLWAQLAVFFMTLDASNRLTLMARFNEITHDLQQPIDQFLQAVVAAECNLTSITISLPPFMVCDKILGGMSAAYAPITTVLQSELTPCDVPNMITAINNWEISDLQKADSAVHAACLAKQLLNETNVLPTIRIIFPAIRPHSCTIVTWIRLFPTIRDSRRLPTTRNLQEPGTPHFTRTALVATRCPPTGYDRSPSAWTTFPCFHSQTLSYTRQTYCVPDTDPSDEAEDIPTQPFPHFTRHID